MTTAISRSAAAFADGQPHAQTRRLRLLRNAQEQKILAPSTASRPVEPPVKREALLLALLALVLHALVTWGLWNRTNTPYTPKFSQEMELIRPQPEVKPEPPKPVRHRPRRWSPQRPWSHLNHLLSTAGTAHGTAEAPQANT